MKSKSLLIVLVSMIASCAVADVGSGPRMSCASDSRHHAGLEQFVVDMSTGDLTTGLEGVCCDRALSMETINSELNHKWFKGEYETTLLGIGLFQWTDTLQIKLDEPGERKPFRLSSDHSFEISSDKEIWTGYCHAMPDYAVGQVWEYDTRPGEEASRLYIVKIDDFPGGKIFHIYVDGLQIKNKQKKSGLQNALPHLPVRAMTLDSSVTNLVETIEDLPDISEGYAYWIESYLSGQGWHARQGYYPGKANDFRQGGVFKVPVKEIIYDIERTIDQ